MKYLGFFCLIGLTSCVCLDPKHKQETAPTVSTQQVIDQLTAAKGVLKEAGESNTKVGQQIDKALTLAERLDQILEYLENTGTNKSIIKPE